MLFAAFLVGLALVPRHRAAAPPAPPPEPWVRVDAGAYSARLTTAAPVVSPVRWGPAGVTPLLWHAAGGTSIRLDGLTPNTRYRAEIDGQDVEFTTPAIGDAIDAHVDRGTIRVAGGAFFPLIAWQECPDRWAPNLQSGINLFAGNPCTGLANVLDAVRGRALVAGTQEDTPGIVDPAVVGWFHPDEADARGYTGDSLPPLSSGLRFLTLTSHFFAQAAPLPAGRGMYPGLVEHADVVGFDLYPLQELCRPDALPWVFDAQQALGALAGGRPTFQWIEERVMKCPQPDAAVTADTVRAESWLAIAGGARGLAFFPSPWGPDVDRMVAAVARRIEQLRPALLQRPLAVEVAPAGTAVRASARSLGGALYVIAVNGGQTAADVRLSAPELGDRTFMVAGTAAAAQAANGGLAASLPPLAVRIYVAAP